MSGNAVLRSAVELVGDDVDNLQIGRAGKAELVALGISHLDGLPAVLVAGDDGNFGIVQ